MAKECNFNPFGFFQKLDTKRAFSANTDFEKSVLISSFLVGNEKGINIKVKQD